MGLSMKVCLKPCFVNKSMRHFWIVLFVEKKSRYLKNGIEINDSWKPKGKPVFAIFKNVTQPIMSDAWNKIWGDGTFHALAYSWPEAQKIIKKLEGSQSTSSSSSSSNDKIAQAKSICKDLGFKTNTEKFADCALKMMSLQFQASNKVSSGGGTKQEIIVKHKQDYDIFDAMIDLSNSMRQSNSSSSSGTNCRVFKKAWGADMVCN